MNKLEYYLQFKKFQQSREKYFGPPLEKALNKQIQQYIQAVKSFRSDPLIWVNSQPIIDILQPLYMDSIKYGAKVRTYLNRQKGYAIGFNERMVQLMQAYFQTDILNTSEGITQTTREIIQQVFSNAIQNGLSINEIVRELENTDLSRLRARMIARTETVTAANQAGRFAAGDLGLQLNKEWLATMDNRTRRDHLIMNGTVTGFDSYFDVPGGVTMLQPGDRTQENGLPVPAKEVVNCRCTTLYLPIKGANGKLLTA